MDTVGGRIKQIRMDMGWTQEKLANEVGLSKSFLSEVENDKTSVSGDNLLKIAEALGASLDYIMKGSNECVEEKRDSIKIPALLSEAAEELGLTYRQTLMLLDIDNSIIARRSSKEKREMNKENWKQLYNKIKDFME